MLEEPYSVDEHGKTPLMPAKHALSSWWVSIPQFLFFVCSLNDVYRLMTKLWASLRWAPFHLAPLKLEALCTTYLVWNGLHSSLCPTVKKPEDFFWIDLILQSLTVWYDEATLFRPHVLPISSFSNAWKKFKELETCDRLPSKQRLTIPTQPVVRDCR